MLRALKRLLDLLGWRRRSQPPGSPRDPYAWKPIPHQPRPPGRTGAVAVAEPEDE